MPVVIDLLSSPFESAPPTRHTSPQARRAPLKRTSPPSRALNFDSDEFDTLDLTAISSGIKKGKSTILKEPITTGTTSSIGLRRQNDDFLFLSDDFDTTGDLGESLHKQPEASSPTTKGNSKLGMSMTRTTSAVVGTKSSRPLHPVGIRRWNSVADPIEHSSSPVIDLSLDDDPFASPPRQKENKPPQKKILRHDSTKDSTSISTSNIAAATSRPTKSLEALDCSSDLFVNSPFPTLTKSPKRKANWDPISSSMPEINTNHELDPFAISPPKAVKRKAVVVDLEDSDLLDTDDEFPDINQIFPKAKTRSYSLSPPPKRSKATIGKKLPPKSAEEKELEKKRKAAAREAEKERKQREKEEAKEQRARQKERDNALAEVNKLRTDKKLSTPEMIVDLPSGLSAGNKIQVTELLKDLDVQCETWDSPVPNVVKWRRKVTSRFNEKLGHWEPIRLRIDPEEYVLVIVAASEFVTLCLGEEGSNLEAHVLKMKKYFADKKFMYMIEGLEPWRKKNDSARNRQFHSAVRGEDAALSSSQPTRRRNNAQQEYIDADDIEDHELLLQVVHGAQIHHTNAPVETAQWIATFTQHISTIPYRKARDAASASAAFCMESGQVRTGENPKDTFIRMLQELSRVTASIAYGIAAEYDSPTKLFQGFEENGPLAVEHCRKSANKDGAFTDRAVGQAISKRLCKIFTGRDEESTEL